jgi:hypothetical protein
MVVVAQLVRAPDCGSGGRGFEPHLPPRNETSSIDGVFFLEVFSFQNYGARGLSQDEPY